MTHRVAHVRFSTGSEGTVECTCSEIVAGVQPEAFREHRKLKGEKAAYLHGGRSLGPPQPAPAHVVASRQRGARR